MAEGKKRSLEFLLEAWDMAKHELERSKRNEEKTRAAVVEALGVNDDPIYLHATAGPYRVNIEYVPTINLLVKEVQS